jgi:hypothetical protein
LQHWAFSFRAGTRPMPTDDPNLTV